MEDQKAKQISFEDFPICGKSHEWGRFCERDKGHPGMHGYKDNFNRWVWFNNNGNKFVGKYENT